MHLPDIEDGSKSYWPVYIADSAFGSWVRQIDSNKKISVAAALPSPGTPCTQGSASSNRGVWEVRRNTHMQKPTDLVCCA